MKFFVRILVAGAVCLGAAAAAVVWLAGPGTFSLLLSARSPRPAAGREPAEEGPKTYADPTDPSGKRRVTVDASLFDADLFSIVLDYPGTIRDPASLEELRQSVRGRSRRAMTEFRTKFDRLRLGGDPGFDEALEGLRACRMIGFAYMNDGKFAEAASWLGRGLELSRRRGMPPDLPRVFEALLGLAALRRGEIENCLECTGPSSCIFPLDPQAVHRQQDGSREAVRRFTAYLKEDPRDLRVRWLLNLAYMTLGEHPDKVPPEYLIPLEPFRSKRDVGRFVNVAPDAGLGARGPNLAGGTIFDDFNNDGLPDLLVTSVDPDMGASLFINRGDGTFDDRSSWANLGEQIYALNASRADFDNDGNLDVLLMRGAWQEAMRLSLLRNKGGGAFEDVTIAAGLGKPTSTESSAWGDYDDDGLVDLFVCGEYREKEPDPLDRCRLYHNEGNGKFVDVAEKAGVTNEHWAKGSAWGDYDNDGRLDLFVSNMDGPCRLYHNKGDGTFEDVAESLGIRRSLFGEPFACWFWDYDSDGWLDIFVVDYQCSLADTVADKLGIKLDTFRHPRLFRNLEGKSFRDVSEEMGLVHPISAMGVNFGDIDNDGDQDVYFGTGWMSYAGLVPNVLLENVDNRRFEDVTDSSRMGHLQKGHGVGFADYDGDGDLDVFINLGGGYPGDAAYSCLFQNPGHGRHWLRVKLVGTKTNRAALGARIEAEVRGADGKGRFLRRMIGSNASFGGNPLTEHLGLGEATSVSRLTIAWPTSRTTQTFRDIPADRELVITEGSDHYQVVTRKPPAGDARKTAAK